MTQKTALMAVVTRNGSHGNIQYQGYGDFTGPFYLDMELAVGDLVTIEGITYVIRNLGKVSTDILFEKYSE